MGTNYYACEDICPTCGKENKRLHIGKSSGGWTFSFKGHVASDFEDVVITSWKEWQEHLSKPNILIRDEYEKTISFEEFKKIVEDKINEKYNHTTYCLNSDKPGDRQYAEENCWLDSEGHSFSKGEFS